MARSRWGSLEKRGPSWEARWTDPLTKKPRRKVVGKIADLGQDLDAATRDELLARVRREVEHTVERGGTFKEFLDSYEGVYRMSVKPVTFGGTYATMHGVARLLPMPMRAVDVPTAEAVLVRLARHGLHRKRPKGLHPNTLRQVVAQLASFWSAARKRGVVTENPWRKLKKPPARKKLIPVKTAAELDELYEKVVPDLKPLAMTLAECGLRIGEAAALSKDDVRRALKQGSLAVKRSKSQPRYVQLTSRALHALRQVAMTFGRDKSVHAFPKIQTRGQQSYHRRRFWTSLAAEGFERMSFHTLRHSFGYRMSRAGNSDAQTGAVMGITEKSAKVYTHHHPDAVARVAIERLEAHESRSSEAAG